MERLFRQHGLPKAIRSDNGSPFASSRALLGLSRLSAWWLALGIELERGRPGCPQDNGGHERMHRDMKLELEQHREDRPEAFEIWRTCYNNDRPHEALGMKTPSEVYKKSDRIYHGTPDELTYENMAVRRVDQIGEISIDGESIFLSTALSGWSVGLKKEIDGNQFEVWFGSLLLGYLDLQTSGFEPSGSKLEKQQETCQLP
jgi:putative transposase